MRSTRARPRMAVIMTPAPAQGNPRVALRRRHPWRKRSLSTVKITVTPMGMPTAIPMVRDILTSTDSACQRAVFGTLVIAAGFLLGSSLTGCAPAPSGKAGSAADPQPGFLYGRVTRVKDGDSLMMVTPDGAPVEIRLSEIDTPEKDRPYANQARQALTQLVQGKNIAVRRFDVDKYDRVVGRVFLGDQDVNAELLRLGLAAVYCRFTDDRVLYRLEQEAREAGRGIWSGRELPRGACVESRPKATSAKTDSACGGKQYCRQMASCEEALFYLRECGLQDMDGDGDGLPCERSLCAGRQGSN